MTREGNSDDVLLLYIFSRSEVPMISKLVEL